MKKILLISLISFKLFAQFCSDLETIPADSGAVSDLISNNTILACPEGTTGLYVDTIEYDDISKTSYNSKYDGVEYPVISSLNESFNNDNNVDTPNGTIQTRIKYFLKYISNACSTLNNPDNVNKFLWHYTITYTNCITNDTYVAPAAVDNNISDINNTLDNDNILVFGDENSTIDDLINNQIIQNNDIVNNTTNIDNSVNDFSAQNSQDLNNVNTTLSNSSAQNSRKLDNVNTTLSNSSAQNSQNLNNINTTLSNSSAQNSQDLSNINTTLGNNSAQNSQDLNNVNTTLSNSSAQNSQDLSTLDNSINSINDRLDSNKADYDNLTTDFNSKLDEFNNAYNSYSGSLSSSLNFDSLTSIIDNSVPNFTCQGSLVYNFSVFGNNFQIDLSVFGDYSYVFDTVFNILLMLFTYFVYSKMFLNIIKLLLEV